MYLRTISQSFSHSVSLLVCRQLNCEEIETLHHTLSSEKKGVGGRDTRYSFTDQMEPQFCTAKQHGLVARHRHRSTLVKTRLRCVQNHV